MLNTFASASPFWVVHVNSGFLEVVHATGLFTASVTFDTPYILGQDGPIMKPFEYVKDEAVRFFLRHNSALYMDR